MYDIIHDMTKRVNTYESRGFTLLGLFKFFYFFLLLYVVYLAVCPEDDTPCKLYDVLNLPLSCLAYRWSAATRPTEWPDSWGITLWTISCLWHFSELLLLSHSIIMLDMSIRALRQNTHLPRRLYVIRGWRNLQIPLSFRCSCWGLEEWPISSLVIKVGDWVCLRSTQRGSLQCTSMLLEIALARSCNPECA